jgi:hypothetical protein
VVIDMKKCFRCKKEKPLNKFHKHKDSIM